MCIRDRSTQSTWDHLIVMKYTIAIFVLFLSSVLCASHGELLSIDHTKVVSKVLRQSTAIAIPAELNGIIDALRDFFIGVWDGLNGTFQYDLRYIRWCYKAPLNLYKIWSQLEPIAIEFFKTWDFFKAYDAIKDLRMRSMIHEKPCEMVYNLYLHFVDLVEILEDGDWEEIKQRIIMTFFYNAQLLIGDIMEIFQCLGDGDYHCVGENVGQILYILIFHQPCLLYTSPSPRDATLSRMPSSA
eukprot:TRINITY_DN7015_c0_g1_i1.p1 TRINITY_DN7015_c0_g1~~TRINITY_DN7015_c0_g1_i1.p1  ORF type:complete len:250 (+),score=44.75 TRINITY_DN7015_c0_g1_i1:27-752(+)